MINSRLKGKAGELELAKKLREYGYDCRRSVQYNGYAPGGQPDVIGLPDIHMECKRVEQLNLYRAVQQAIRDNKDPEAMPAVFHRKNRQPWLVTMELNAWMKLYERGRNDKKK